MAFVTIGYYTLNTPYQDEIADAVVNSYPVLFDNITCDIAAYYDPRLRSGTLYIGNSQKAKTLVQLWIQAQKQTPLEWDQRVLERVLKEQGQGFDVYKLPPEYCHIFDHKHNYIPVITHNQASRRFKKNTNEGKYPC